MITAVTPWNAQWQLRAEMSRLIRQLALILQRHRDRGRSTDANAIGSLMIEPSEADGLISDLAASWSAPEDGPRPRPAGSDDNRREIAARAQSGAAQGSFLPLWRAAANFELRSSEYDALLLALAVELDPRCGRLVAYLNDHVGHTRPTIGLAGALAEIQGQPVLPMELVNRPLIRDGLLDLEGEGPVPGLALRLDPEMAARLSSDQLSAPLSSNVSLHRAEIGSLGRLVLDDRARERLSGWSLGLREQRGAPVLVVAGPPESGKTAAVVAAAGEAGLPVAELRSTADALEERIRLGRRESRWYNAALLVKIEPVETMNWAALWRRVQDVRAPVVIETDAKALDQVRAAAPYEPTVVLIQDPGVEMRSRLWRSVLSNTEQLETGDLERLAGAFHFTAGRISRAVRRAQAEVAELPPGHRRLTVSVLEKVCRSIGSAGMSSLAQKLALPYTMSDLIVPDHLRAELHLAVAWVRYQQKVLEGWNFGRRVPFGHGLTALFSGPPGTGKTMAAQVLAHELGLDLYRIDLSRVMSKYIGETEKNLARLFEEAYAAGAILFFDEADAIFGKRTEVRDAHDRYANVEIGYLLQRMEEHDGVTILATNRMRDMDEGFIRRFHFILNFSMPGEADRLRIWNGMFPAEAERDTNLDLRPLARNFEVTGGEIRNTVLAAAFLAASDGRPIEMTHLRRALRRELGKNGRVVDERALEAL